MLRILRRLSTKVNQSSYHIGFIEKTLINSSLNWYSRVNWVDSHLFDKEGWFADPFFYSVEDNVIILLAEQWYYPINRGRLVKMYINRTDFVLEKVEPILTLNTHLSFPYIWKENNKTYVLPENYQSGLLNIWELDGNSLSLCATLINEPLLDSQLFKIGNEYFIFGVKYASGNWDDYREVKIWSSKGLYGPFSYKQSISNECNIERGAGKIFYDGDNIIRPVQNCEGAYGKETILLKLEYDGTYFSEKEYSRIIPDRENKYGNVLHTFNEESGICVLDGLNYHYPFLHKLYEKLKSYK